MFNPAVVQQFNTCAWLMDRYVDGLSHDESMTPAPTGNTINWLVGHLADARNGLLGALTGRTLWPAAELAKYKRGTTPPQANEALQLDDLLKRYASVLGPLVEATGSLSPEQADKKSPVSPTGDPNETLGTLLATCAFHEAYHLGQIGLLRRAVGKPGLM